MNLIGKHVTTAFFVIIVVTAGSGIAQTGGGRTLTCYSARTGQRIPCPSAPQPAQPTSPPSSTSPPPDDSARIEAERRAAAEAERKRREAAERAAEERQRIERERQEKFERDKQETLNSLKGNSSGDSQLKGATGSDLKLKDGSSTELKLKDSSPDYNRVRKPATGGVRGGDDTTDYSQIPYDLDGLGKLAEKLGWSDAELKRFLKAALELGNFAGRYTKVQRQAMWTAIKDRDTRALQKAAAAETGAGMPSSGFQTGKYSDCVIFAISNASGVPYGFTAARATELLKSEEWRLSYEKDDPQNEVLKTVPGQRRGMTGNEMLFLTEAFGQAEVVKPKDFAGVLKAGRPVLVNVAFGHQVILSKTFQYKGETWYEMIDSQSKGSWQRRYVKPSELDVLLLENGVVYKPEPGTTVKSLK